MQRLRVFVDDVFPKAVERGLIRVCTVTKGSFTACRLEETEERCLAEAEPAVLRIGPLRDHSVADWREIRRRRDGSLAELANPVTGR